MSLFIGGLAFDDPALAAAIKVGVLGGSVLSAVMGYLLFLAAAPNKGTS
jgi:NhaA family Na+:H+ antiporter